MLVAGRQNTGCSKSASVSYNPDATKRALAIEWLKAASQKAVAGLLKLSWDEIHGIMERAVKRGLERRQAEPVTQLGVDEKAFRKGHHYLTLVNDLARGRVLYVAQAGIETRKVS